MAGIEHISYFGVIFCTFAEQTVQRSVWIYQLRIISPTFELFCAGEELPPNFTTFFMMFFVPS